MKRLLALISVTDVLFFGGLFLLAYGAERLHQGLGLFLVGLILVLYVRPLKGWWMK